MSTADLPVFVASAERLANFIETRPVAHVLGTHIEQSTTPYVDYPRGSTYQPEEHSLDLPPASVLELKEGLLAMQGTLHRIERPDFTLVPRGAPAITVPQTTAALSVK